MKKALGMIFAVMMVGVILTGCYQRTCCEQPAPQHYSMKGEG